MVPGNVKLSQYHELLHCVPKVQSYAFSNAHNLAKAIRSGTPTLSYLDPSCGIPVDQYLWLNDLHPTYPMHNLIASRIVQQLGV